MSCALIWDVENLNLFLMVIEISHGRFFAFRLARLDPGLDSQLKVLDSR